MRALVFHEGLHYSNEYPVPEPGEGEALVKVHCAGICNTDLEIIRGYMDFTGIPGHEFAGVVEGTASGEMVGRRVTGEINLTCGNCRYCLQNIHYHCTERSVLGILNRDGVFAEYVTLPVDNLHLIPDSVSDEEAVFVEPLAAALEILDQVHIRPDDDVCVLGDGKLGLLVGQVLASIACRLTVFGNHENKLSLLRKFGIRTEYVSAAPERSFDIVIDCTGSLSGIDIALKVVRPRGTIVVKTTVAESGLVDLNSIVIHEVTLIGSRCGPFPPSIRMIEQGRVDVLSLVNRVFKLEEGLRAFEYASRKDVLKVLITP
jgi:threonine dehydrogenase-like Zn-dependent dehydrogenase